jgi:thiol:disulfide interchange protein DsbD
VVVALYVDDKTELPKSEQYVSKYDNKEKTTLGKKNADLQLTGFSVNAQPYYVLLDPSAPADLRHALVPPIGYEPDATEFVKFLDSGLARFQQQRAVASSR